MYCINIYHIISYINISGSVKTLFFLLCSWNEETDEMFLFFRNQNQCTESIAAHFRSIQNFQNIKFMDTLLQLQNKVKCYHGNISKMVQCWHGNRDCRLTGVFLDKIPWEFPIKSPWWLVSPSPVSEARLIEGHKVNLTAGAWSHRRKEDLKKEKTRSGGCHERKQMVNSFSAIVNFSGYPRKVP